MGRYRKVDWTAVDFYTLIGLAGVTGYVASYALLQLGMLDGNSVLYSAANVAAASMVLVSLTADFNLASAIIQVVWIVIGIVGLGLRQLRKRRQGELCDVIELDTRQTKVRTMRSQTEAQRAITKRLAHAEHAPTAS